MEKNSITIILGLVYETSKTRKYQGPQNLLGLEWKGIYISLMNFKMNECKVTKLWLPNIV